jgi:gliding motility-associated-like protein
MFLKRSITDKQHGKISVLLFAMLLIRPLLAESAGHPAVGLAPVEILVSSAEVCPGDPVELSFTDAATNFYWGISTDNGNSYPIIDSSFQNPFVTQITENTRIRLDVRDEFDAPTYYFVDLLIIIPEDFVCLATIELELDEICQVDIPNLLDLQNPQIIQHAISYTQTPAAGSTDWPQEIVLSYLGQCASSFSCSVEVTTTDNLDPQISCVPIVQVNLPDFESSVLVNVPIPDISGECSLYLLENDLGGTNNTIEFSYGTTPIVWTATDAYGNSSNCQTLVEVIDVSPPSYSNCADTVHFSTTSSSCEGWLNYTPVVTDNVGISLFYNDMGFLPGDSALIALGSYNLVWTATDVNGLSATCSTAVFIDDVIAPFIDCPPTLYTDVPSSSCTVFLDLPVSIATDNCGIESTWSFPAGSNMEFGVGTYVITYFASDYEFNITQCETEIIVADIQGPLVECPSTMQAYTVEGNCSILVDAPVVEVSDNCGVDESWNVLSNGLSLPATLEQGNYTVSWFASDIHGNQSVCYTLLVVADLTGPVFSCQNEITLYSDENCQSEIPDLSSVALSAFDCTGIATFTQSPLPGSPAFGVQSIELTAFDIWGNSSSCISELIHVDVIAPELFNCPVDQSAALDANCQFTLPDYRSLLSVTDNCTANPIINQNPSPGSLLTGSGIHVIEITVADDSGNTSICLFEFTLTDQLAPTVVNSSIPADLYLNESCQVLVPDLTGMVTFSDNCSSVLYIAQNPNAGMLINETGSIEITVLANDESGNETGFEFSLDVIDNTPPVVTILQNEVTIYLDGNCETIMPSLESFISLSENCSETVGIVQNPAPGTLLSGPSTFSTELIITDVSGNQTTETIDVVVLDNTAPIITCLPQQLVELTGDLCSDWINLDIPTVIENCSSYTLSNTLTDDTFQLYGEPGSYFYSWHVVDSHGYLATCATEVVVVDMSPPVIDCPDDIAYCEEFVSINVPAVMDNCGVQSIEISHADWVSSGIFPYGETILTVTATDIHGNVSSCEFSIFHYDPIQCCPTQAEAGTIVTTSQEHYCIGETITLSAQGYVGEPIWQYSINSTDWTDIPNSESEEYTFELTESIWIRIAASIPFCETAYSEPIYFEPYIIPHFDCPSNETLFTDQNCEGLLPDFITEWALNYNNPNFVFEQNPAAGSLISTELSNVELSVQAYCGTTYQCAFEVMVVDNLSPTFTSNWPIELVFPLGVNCEMVVPTDILSYGDISDNCSSQENIELIILNSTNDDVLHQIHLELQATDESGNNSSHNLILQYIDQTAPQVNCIPSVNITLDATCMGLMPDLNEIISSSDNCGISNIIQIPSPGLPISTGIHEVQFIVSDNAGISSSCLVEVHAVDVLVPVITCPDEFTVYVNDNCEAFVPDLSGSVVVSDECSYTVQQLPLAGTLVIQDVLVTLFATDPSGNQSTCEIQVLVEDTISGELICPADITQYLTADECEVVVNYEVLFNDNCSGVWPEIVSGQLSGSSFEAGEYVIAWSALENGTELHTCYFNISVLDTIAPILPEDSIIQTCNPIVDFEIPDMIEPCSATLFRIDGNGFNPGDELPIGITEFIYVALDISGNSDTTHIQCIVENPGILEFTTDQIEVCNDGNILALYDYISSNINWIISTPGYENGLFVPSSHTPGAYDLMVSNDGGYCDVSDILVITVHENGLIEFLGETTFCGTEAQLEFNGNCNFLSSDIFPGGYLTVSDDLTECNVIVPNYGDYLIEVFGETEYNCPAHIEVELTFLSSISDVNAGEDIQLYSSQTLDLTGSFTGDGTGSWTALSGDLEVLSSNGNDIQVSVTQPGLNYLIFSADGATCGSDSDTLLITLNLLEIPNTITPNGDGINDRFVIPGADRQNCEIIIHDRWGYKVFSSKKYQNNWPSSEFGERMPDEDVYYYQVILNDKTLEGFFMVKND